METADGTGDGVGIQGDGLAFLTKELGEVGSGSGAEGVNSASPFEALDAPAAGAWRYVFRWCRHYVCGILRLYLVW